MKNKESEIIFNRLKKNLDFRTEKKVFSKYFGSFIWFLTSDVDSIPNDFKKIHSKSCSLCKCSNSSKDKCVSRLHKIMKKAKASSQIESFKCSDLLHGFCYPIVQGKRLMDIS